VEHSGIIKLMGLLSVTDFLSYKYLFLEIVKAQQKYQMHNDEIV